MFIKNSRLSIAVISVIFTLLISIIPFVIAYGSLLERVDNIKETQYNTNNELTETIKNMESRIIELEKTIERTDVSLENIKTDIQEIKEDLKTLIKKLN